MTKFGIDVLQSRDYQDLKGLSYGLVTNPTGVNSELIPTWQLLKEAAVGDLAVLFGPEHGWLGNVQDELAVESGIDPFIGLPVLSLYGKKRRQPSAEMLKDLDALVFDLQDVGVRFYTYISTLYYCLEACAREGLKMIVLDRPNPLGGTRVEGTVLEPPFRSFLGIAPLATRHGLTMAELALLFNQESRAELTVLPLEGWQRSQWYDQTGLPWVFPSPNIPTQDTVILYPGTCLIEGTNLSEGRGTTKPFELFGAPWLDCWRSAELLNRLKLPGVRFRACQFTPTYGKHYNTLCQGVQVHIRERDLVRPVALGLEILAHLLREYPHDFSWRPDPGDGANCEYPFIDWLLGTDRIRPLLEQGNSAEQILAGESVKLQSFLKLRQEVLLY